MLKVEIRKTPYWGDESTEVVQCSNEEELAALVKKISGQPDIEQVGYRILEVSRSENTKVDKD